MIVASLEHGPGARLGFSGAVVVFKNEIDLWANPSLAGLPRSEPPAILYSDQGKAASMSSAAGSISTQMSQFWMLLAAAGLATAPVPTPMPMKNDCQ